MASLTKCQNQNNIDKGSRSDGEVHCRTPARKGCFLTRTQCFAAFLSALLVITIVGVISAVASRKCDCHEESWRPAGHLNVSRVRPFEPHPTVDPQLPWGDIRLPRDLIPSLYNLQLRVDLNTFGFSGSVDIAVSVEQTTRYIMLHVNKLKVDRRRVTIIRTDLDLPHGSEISLRIIEQFQVLQNDFYVLKASTLLRKGHRYLITFGNFTGVLADDLRGLYRSSYTTKKGQTK